MQATVHGVAQSQTRLSDFTSLKRVEKVRGKAAAAAAKLLQWCPTLCDPIDGSPPGSPVPGILQARTLGVGCHFLLRGIFPTQGSNCIQGLLYLLTLKRETAAAAKSLQLCLILCDPMICSLPGSSVHGIFQARILEWGVIAFSNVSAVIHKKVLLLQKHWRRQ